MEVERDHTPRKVGDPEPDDPTAITGGALMVRALRAEGVDCVFGIPGSSEIGFVDALVDEPALRYVLGLHEGPITAMAHGYATVSGRPAFVALHAVAGMANALGQIVNAALDRTPLVVVAGTQDTRLRGRGAFLESPGLSTLAQPYAKWTWDLLRADTIPDVVRHAFAMASTPPGGPVVLIVSKNLWHYAVPAAARQVEPRRLLRASAPHPDAVDHAVKQLLAAEMPLLLAGDELVQYGGMRQLVELAELLGAPVVGELATGHGRVSFPTRHPQYLGLFHGQRACPVPFDLLLDAGGRMFSEFDVAPDPIVRPGVPLLHLTVDASQIGRAFPVDTALIGDPAAGLTAMLRQVRGLLPPEHGDHRARRLARVASARAGLDAQRARRLTAEHATEGIPPARLAVALNDALSADAIVVTELITSDPFHSDYIDYHNGESGRLHVSSNGGAIGWGIGAACGAKLAAPGREVVLLSGDGSFQFGVQGLWTAARYQIPVLFVVWNNGGYQSNRHGLVKYRGRAVATGRYIGTELPMIDHVAIAGGYGVAGGRVRRVDELPAAIASGLVAVRAGRPFVLDVAIDRSGAAGTPGDDRFAVDTVTTADGRPASSRG